MVKKKTDNSYGGGGISGGNGAYRMEIDNRFRQQYPQGQQTQQNQYDSRNEDQAREQELRGSCQNVLKKFEYSNLRNTTHFNPLNKFSTNQGEQRNKVPSNNEDNIFKSLTSAVNKTLPVS